MDPKERLVREFYAARARRDRPRICELLAGDVVWREKDGNQDYSGEHRGRDAVDELLAKLVAVTAGTFTLEPGELICTADHVAVAVRWRAERNGVQAEGNDLAVYRIAEGRIADAWFFPDGYDPQAVSEVFSFARAE
jgi:hypothetical protein